MAHGPSPITARPYCPMELLLLFSLEQEVRVEIKRNVKCG